MRCFRTVLILLALWPAIANAFVVESIRVEGLRRISQGTLFTHLPVNIGDVIDRERIAAAMDALYDSGLFEVVELRREDGTLIVAVEERPQIERIEISGNRDITTDNLEKALEHAGLAGGRPFDKSALDGLERSLTGIYLSFGLYSAVVDASVEKIPDNKVVISIEIREGARARIRQINIVGNRSFREDELLEQFRLRVHSLTSAVTGSSRYSRVALQADIESLTSFYTDRGYADFEVLSTQVAVSPDKDAIFITINVAEGALYTISAVEIAGATGVPEAELEKLTLVRSGQIFNHRRIQQSADLMASRLGMDGYAFASVRPTPTFDAATREARIVFLVRAGDRITVRRIEFAGATRINDEVLRREMRQLEGTHLDTTVLERSRQSLERLPYVERVETEVRRIAATPDLADIHVTLTEQPARRYGGGGGFSDAQRLSLNGYFVNENLFGTGQRLALDITANEFSSVFGVAHTDPYLRVDGLSRQISLRYRDIDRLTDASSSLDTKTVRAALEYSYRATERHTLRLGLAPQDSELETSTSGSLQAQQWIANNGNPSVSDDGSQLSTDFYNVDLLAGWRYDSRNRAVLADRGTRQDVSLRAAIPGSEVEYYTIDYDLVNYWPVAGNWTLRTHTRLAFGQDYGTDTTSLPPYLNWFAGGPNSVRGFRESRLGPRDSLNNPYGGNLLVAGQLELLLPMPEKWRRTVRATLFYDIGNVFAAGGVTFVDDAGDPLDYDFDFDELRQSAGIALEWITPLGPLQLSYGIPLNEDENNPNRFLRDEVDSFQIQIGFSF